MRGFEVWSSGYGQRVNTEGKVSYEGLDFTAVDQYSMFNRTISTCVICVQRGYIIILFLVWLLHVKQLVCRGV